MDGGDSVDDKIEAYNKQFEIVLLGAFSHKARCTKSLWRMLVGSRAEA